MTNKKFAFGKAYNVTVNGEGLDINLADVEFCIMQEGFSVVLPLKHIKESVFELKIPATLSNVLSKKTDIEFSITVKKDNLCFEVMKESFDLEYFKIKSVKIEEAGASVEEEISDEIPKPTPEAVVIAEKIERPEKKTEPVHIDPSPVSKSDELKNALLESLKRGKAGTPTPSPRFVSKRLKDLLKK